MADATKGRVDPDTGQKYYTRGDGSNVAEETRVRLTPAEDREVQSTGEVEVVRGNRTITVGLDESGTPQPEVVYYD